MSFYIHPRSICDTQKIGNGTRIWANTRILENVEIGENCNICDFVFIESGVRIGNNVTIKCGVYLWNETIIEDDVFIGPNATFTNDRFPRSKKYDKPFESTILKKGCSIGANCTILPGLTIGENSMVGAGSVVIKNVNANSIVVGNPAKQIKLINNNSSN